MDTHYFYLKLGNGNCEAEYWLNQIPDVQNVVGNPAAAIFFDKTKTKELRELIKNYVDTAKSEDYKELYDKRKEEGKKIPSFTDLKNQIKPFIDAGDGTLPKKAIFVTIVSKSGLVYILEPAGQVVDDMPEKDYDAYDAHLLKLKIKEEKDKEYMKTKEIHSPKYMFVKIIKKCTEVPHVLASLSCNRYLNSGTFRKIVPDKNGGAIQAIKFCLGEQLETVSGEKRLSLLSWHQLETLVFLILKNAGVHPSAWRGGTLPEIDISAKNFDSEKKPIGTNNPIVFEPSEKIDFQIKRSETKIAEDAKYYTIAIDYTGKKHTKVRDAKWLIEQIEKQPDTKEWFNNALNWSCRCC